jgi:hypothetical protein
VISFRKLMSFLILSKVSIFPNNSASLKEIFCGR